MEPVEEPDVKDQAEDAAEGGVDEENDDESDDDFEGEDRVQSLPTGTFRFRLQVPGDAPLLFNFRENVAPPDTAKEETSPKEPQEGVEAVPEAEFRYPVQNRFTGLIERIQNNPDFLEGYDLSDSFIAEDSEEEEDSEDKTVFGGFFINKGAILKKPGSEFASPEKEKKRPRKAKNSDGSDEEEGTRKRGRASWTIPSELQAEIDALRKRADKEQTKENGRIAPWLKEPLNKIGRRAQELHPKGYMPASVLQALQEFLDMGTQALRAWCTAGGKNAEDGKSSRDQKRDSKGEIEMKQGGGEAAGKKEKDEEKPKEKAKEEKSKGKDDVKDKEKGKKSKKDKRDMEEQKTEEKEKEKAREKEKEQEKKESERKEKKDKDHKHADKAFKKAKIAASSTSPSAPAATTAPAPAPSPSPAPLVALPSVPPPPLVSRPPPIAAPKKPRGSSVDVAKESLKTLTARINEASQLQPPNWQWSDEVDMCLYNVLNTAKLNLQKQGRAITAENKAQLDVSKHKPPLVVKTEIKSTYDAIVGMFQYARFNQVTSEVLHQRFKKVSKALKEERSAAAAAKKAAVVAVASSVAPSET